MFVTLVASANLSGTTSITAPCRPPIFCRILDELEYFLRCRAGFSPVRTMVPSSVSGGRSRGRRGAGIHPARSQAGRLRSAGGSAGCPAAGGRLLFLGSRIRPWVDWLRCLRIE